MKNYRFVAEETFNYRPISILPPISDIFEKLLRKQLSIYTKNKL